MREAKMKSEFRDEKQIALNSRRRLNFIVEILLR